MLYYNEPARRDRKTRDTIIEQIFDEIEHIDYQPSDVIQNVIDKWIYLRTPVNEIINKMAPVKTTKFPPTTLAHGSKVIYIISNMKETMHTKISKIK